MAKLAIKGHKTRGKEVIALLEMLGGKNELHLIGCEMSDCYHIIKGGVINNGYVYPEGFTIFTLEEFEKEFPYKVGDEVRLGVPDEVRITNMYWDPCSDQVIYEALSVNGGREYDNLHAKQLSPCKEKSSPDKAKAPSLEGEDYSEGRCGYKIPEGFEFDKVENGEIILKPKKKVLPKTYEECCEVIGISRHDVEIDLPQPYQQNMFNLFKLLICRDAYWKLADDWSFKIGGNSQEVVHGITIWETDIVKDFYYGLKGNLILVFPTEEMRDTFYENFKDLIDECKELL